MAYNPALYYPQSYQPYPAYQPQQMQQQSQPSKYVEAVPVDTEAEAENCPMAAGTSAVFFARNDSFIAVKAVGVNGQVSFSVFDKRPPAPEAPVFDPSAFVRRDELPALLAEALEKTKLPTSAKRASRETEAAE